MNRLILVGIFQLIGSGLISSQEFVFTMVFTDTLGNSDTLELGYDEGATEGLDTHFGEVNISTTPWDSIFEIRVTSELRPTDAEPIIDFHSKRQITKKMCSDSYPPPIEIDIKAIHWPVAAQWNLDLFQDSCNRGSLITSIAQGGWWDVGSPSNLDRIELATDSMISFTDNISLYDNGNLNGNYAYRDSLAGLVSVFWVGLGREALGVSTREYDLYPNLQIFPNPIHDQIRISGIRETEIEQIELYNMDGKRIIVTNSINFTIKELNAGIYILSILERNGYRINRKLVKN